jgi:hypothetical protein
MPLYECQVPDCNNKVSIRSKIKKGELKGLMACGHCKKKFDGSGIKKTTEKTKDKRKLERSGLPLFFDTAIKSMSSKPLCENCGAKIKFWLSPTHNIAHILSKRRYKSVMCEPENYVILCSDKDQANNCHERFDNKVSERVEMPVFDRAKKKYLKFSDKCLENGQERIIFDEN